MCIGEQEVQRLKKKKKNSDNGPQNTTQKTKDYTTRTLRETARKLKCSLWECTYSQPQFTQLRPEKNMNDFHKNNTNTQK